MFFAVGAGERWLVVEIMRRFLPKAVAGDVLGVE